MRVKVKEMKREAVEPRVETHECHHYWLIESAKGHTSQGVCKLCGTTKEFYNSIPEADPAVVKKRVPFQEMPELSVDSGEQSSS